MPVIQEIDSFLRKREAEQGWVDGTIKSTLLNKKTETLLKKRIDKILGIL